MHVRAIFPIAFCATLAFGLCGCDTSEGDPDSALAALYQCPEPAVALAKQSQDTIILRDPIAPDSLQDQRVIQLFRGYPPVAGLDTPHPGYQVAVQDSRTLTGNGAVMPGSGNQIGWIVPVGFDSAAAAGRFPNLDASVKEKCFSAYQVVSKHPYTSSNVILDSQCRPVREFPFTFAKPDTLNSVPTFIVWDLKDKAGKVAPSGDYYWNVELESGNARRILRTKIRITTDASCE